METRLTAQFIQTVKKPGKYGDGGGSGMFLLVKESGRKSYVQRITIRGKVRDIGLGSTRLVTLAEARAAAYENRKLARMGGDPLALKQRPEVPTFAETVDKVIGIHAAGWKDNGKSEKQWRASLRDYAMPRLGNCRVSNITSANVMAVLLPIWNDKRETARRVRQRISAVMLWAIAQGYRPDNPAGEAIANALPKNNQRHQHQRTLPYAEVAAAISKVRSSGAYRATILCFEFLVLTAARSGEVRFATWNEIDFDKRT